MITVASSYLFVPANRSDRVIKAIESGTDAVIIDLEDAVSLEDKDAARESLEEHWGRYSSLAKAKQGVLLLRVNPADTQWHDADIACANRLQIEDIVVPKANDAESLARLATRLPNARLYPLLETAQGFRYIADIASASNVGRLLLGAVDLMLDLGIKCDDSPLHYYRSLIVQHSKVAGLPSPVDGVCVAINDAERLHFEVQRAKNFGFGGKMLIHPKHVALTVKNFAPSDEEIIWARRVVEATHKAEGKAVAVDGKMVDRPILLQAERLLAAAQIAK